MTKKVESTFVYLLVGDLVFLLSDGLTLLALLILHRISFLNKVSQEETEEGRSFSSKTSILLMEEVSFS